MLRTEEEASAIRCQESFNAPPVKSDGTTAYIAMFCLGTDCMSWRWGEGADEITTRAESAGSPDGDGWQPINETPEYTNMLRWSRPRGDRRRGFCGKVGMPK